MLIHDDGSKFCDFSFRTIGKLLGPFPVVIFNEGTKFFRKNLSAVFFLKEQIAVDANGYGCNGTDKERVHDPASANKIT